jgi:glycogen operon protein
MRDLVSYNEKHNEANGEGGNDGESHNRSWNCGVEGETSDEAVLDLRARQQRNFLTTLLLSQGVPMIAHGDELSRTQHGNNNVYCQDNEIAWVSWELDDDNKVLLEFTRRLMQLRAAHPVFRRRRFFAGDAGHGGESELGDIVWFRPDSSHMDEQAWGDGRTQSLLVFLNGGAIPEPDPRGQPQVDDSFLLLLNASAEDVEFTLPDEAYGAHWLISADTADPAADHDSPQLASGATVNVTSRSVIVLRAPRAASA